MATPEALPAADLARRTDLRRMKAVAASLLVFAALAYLVTERVARAQGSQVADWVLFARAAAAAGMVGGLADWFAVTALFRRPLGLPIPHTAIIPSRKDAIGRSLGEFVGTNFLAEDVVRERLRQVRPTARAGAWLADPAHARRVTAELATAVRAVLGVLRDDDVQSVLEQAVTTRLATMPAGPALGRVLAEVVADGAHHGLVDLSLANAHRWLVENQDAVVESIARQAPAWSPRFVDERVAERVHAEVLRVVADVRDDPRHELRAAMDRFLAAYAQDLQHDPATQRRAEEVKAALLAHPQVRQAVGEAGATIRRLVLEAVDDENGELRARVAAAVAGFGVRMATDADLQGKIDGWVQDAAAHVATNYRGELTSLITDTVERWDGPATARRIELQVGQDLQFIRINGTVVGALAGLAIEVVTRLSG
jgi:uncharacterized membrane-anchored protein YjiN (DUF445 family)